MAIKISYELELNEFEAWSGGLERLNRIKELDIVDEIQTLLEDWLCDNNDVDEYLINDILWFELDDIIDSYEGGNNNE